MGRYIRTTLCVRAVLGTSLQEHIVSDLLERATDEHSISIIPPVQKALARTLGQRD